MSKGIWFYGLSGSGKTYAANIVKSVISNSYPIDGDDVRKFISTDLNYTTSDRTKQIGRIFGLIQLTIKNGLFPVASSVFMDRQTFNKCDNLNVQIVRIERSFAAVSKVRDLYDSDAINVVGKDIELQDIGTTIITNCGSEKFERKIKNYIKQVSNIQFDSSG